MVGKELPTWGIYVVFNMIAKQQDKHRHHQQPQFYLKGFAADSSNPYQKTSDIWVYKKGEPYKQALNPSLESVKDTGFTDNFYAFVEKDGSINFNKYEDLLMKEFENTSNPVLEKIRRFEMIDNEEKKVFSRYVTSMKIRGNFGRKLFFDAQINERIEKQQALIRQGWNEEEVSNALKELVIIHEKEWKSERRNLRMVEIAKKYADIIYKLNWQFFLAPDKHYFMTSDNPVSWEEIKTQKAWVLFPIASKICLLASSVLYPKHNNWKERENKFWEIDDEAFEGISEKIVFSAINEMYFSKKSEELVQFINNRI